MAGSSLKLKKNIWTTLIMGDLDTDGRVFSSIVEAFEKQNGEVEALYRHYNKQNVDYGTHARLLLVAVLMTHGDILELGTGLHSTKLIHDVFEEDNKKEKRMLVSADSDLTWLKKSSELSSSFHQLLFVPMCSQENVAK